MLVLSRKPGEQITIGEQILVTVLQVRGNRVTLGFLGPGEVPIQRKERARPVPQVLRAETRDRAGAHPGDAIQNRLESRP
jgi:carbon storage regulator